MRRLFSKKASLNISIEAIVIIVIAMALLGLGLVFVRSQFGQITSTSTEVQEQAREQVTGQLRASGEKVSLPRQIQFGKNEQKVVTLGVQNTESSTLYFRIKIRMDPCNSDLPQGLTKPDCGSVAALDSDAAKKLGTDYFKIRVDTLCQQVAPSDAIVFPVNIKAPSIGGTYAVKVDVDRFTDEACGTSATPSLYATKLSFMTVG